MGRSYSSVGPANLAASTNRDSRDGFSLRHKKKPHPEVRFFEQGADQAAMLPLSLFIAFFSSWRIRSAETLYLAANSCSVAFSSASQRW